MSVNETLSILRNADIFSAEVEHKLPSSNFPMQMHRTAHTFNFSARLLTQ